MKNNEKEQNNFVWDAQLKAKLNNSGWQKSLAWRLQTIFAVAEARKRGKKKKK